ncbi:uncharacterized protein LOC117301022 [Asterias rubens]|uniref:uncharacterized protein LOC117301022 n=1 Tax=Asterias rubens TaxID=7604 RepID=UPI00145538A4|nr:uncharacterized protein LOC117301022 [Asterias rubens]
MGQKQNQRRPNALTQQDEAKKEPLTNSKEQQSHQCCTDDLTQQVKATERSVPKIKPRTTHNQQTNDKEMPEGTDELNQKGQKTERSAPEIKRKPKHDQHTPGKELPAIKKHLKQFNKKLREEVFKEQLKQLGGSDITSKFFADLNFTCRKMDKRGGSLQLKSHGIVLYIPSRALGDDLQDIFIYVKDTVQSSYQTVKMIFCGTSGPKGNISAILTFPMKHSCKWELCGDHQGSVANSSADKSGCMSDTVKFCDGLCIMITDHSIRREDQRLTDARAADVPPLTVKTFYLGIGATEPSDKDGEMNITSKEPQLRLIVYNVEDQHATITAQVAV